MAWKEVLFTSNIIDLGVGTSFDVSSYNGFENFTEDNFIIEQVKSETIDKSYPAAPKQNYVFGKSLKTKTYNQSTGILTAYYQIYGLCGYGITHYESGIINADVRAYLIL